MEINLKKLPKKLRTLNKEELITYINKTLKLEYNFLQKLELQEIQYLLIQITKYGRNLSAGGFVAGSILF